MFGKMSVGVRSAASAAEDRDQDRENHEGVRTPERGQNDPHGDDLLTTRGIDQTIRQPPP